MLILEFIILYIYYFKYLINLYMNLKIYFIDYFMNKNI